MAIQVASFLVPRNSATWYLLEDKYLKGGLRICADVAERTAIHASSLKKGMLVLLVTDNKLYQLTNVSTKTWAEYSTGGSGGGGGGNTLYTHLQTIPTDTWMIGHNKSNRHFISAVYDDTGELILPDSISIIDENTVRVKFLYPLGGHCVLGFDTSNP